MSVVGSGFRVGVWPDGLDVSSARGARLAARTARCSDDDGVMTAADFSLSHSRTMTCVMTKESENEK